jgi:hypothetical protein
MYSETVWEYPIKSINIETLWKQICVYVYLFNYTTHQSFNEHNTYTGRVSPVDESKHGK